MPFCNVTLKTPKLLSTTLGDHIRKKRLNLKIFQRDVAKILGTDTDTVTYWETNRTEPSPTFIPKIISFLGYVPLSILPEDPRKRFVAVRRLIGMSQKEFANILSVDQRTLRKWENGKRLSADFEKTFSELVLKAISRLAQKQKIHLRGI